MSIHSPHDGASEKPQQFGKSTAVSRALTATQNHFSNALESPGDYIGATLRALDRGPRKMSMAHLVSDILPAMRTLPYHDYRRLVGFLNAVRRPNSKTHLAPGADKLLALGVSPQLRQILLAAKSLRELQMKDEDSKLNFTGLFPQSLHRPEQKDPEVDAETAESILLLLRCHYAEGINVLNPEGNAHRRVSMRADRSCEVFNKASGDDALNRRVDIEPMEDGAVSIRYKHLRNGSMETRRHILREGEDVLIGQRLIDTPFDLYDLRNPWHPTLHLPAQCDVGDDNHYSRAGLMIALRGGQLFFFDRGSYCGFILKEESLETDYTAVSIAGERGEWTFGASMASEPESRRPAFPTSRASQRIHRTAKHMERVGLQPRKDVQDFLGSLPVPLMLHVLETARGETGWSMQVILYRYLCAKDQRRNDVAGNAWRALKELHDECSVDERSAWNSELREEVTGVLGEDVAPGRLAEDKTKADAHMRSLAVFAAGADESIHEWCRDYFGVAFSGYLKQELAKRAEEERSKRSAAIRATCRQVAGSVGRTLVGAVAIGLSWYYGREANWRESMNSQTEYWQGRLERSEKFDGQIALLHEWMEKKCRSPEGMNYWQRELAQRELDALANFARQCIDKEAEAGGKIQTLSPETRRKLGRLSLLFERARGLYGKSEGNRPHVVGTIDSTPIKYEKARDAITAKHLMHQPVWSRGSPETSKRVSEQILFAERTLLDYPQIVDDKEGQEATARKFWEYRETMRAVGR